MGRATSNDSRWCRKISTPAGAAQMNTLWTDWRAAVTRRLRLGSGFPFEKPLPGDEAAHQRPDNGVEGQQRLVGQVDQVEQADKRALPKAADGIAHGTLQLVEIGAAQTEAKLDHRGHEHEK